MGSEIRRVVRAKGAGEKACDAPLLCCCDREVAHQLKQGTNVQPENFSAVTIFLCDIVSFTPLAAAMKPIEVRIDCIAHLTTVNIASLHVLY